MNCANTSASGKSGAPPAAGTGAWRTVGVALVVAVIMGVAEVIARFGFTGKSVEADWLAMAIYANVALLGLTALAITVIGLGADRLLASLPTSHRGHDITAIRWLFFGAMVGVLTYQTEVLGFAAGGGARRLLFAIGVGAFAGLLAWGQRRLGARRPARALLAAATLVWLLSVIATGAGVRRTAARFDEWVTLGPTTGRTSASGKPNIVLLVLDTLRADRVGVYAGGDLTPNLDRLAGSSTVYTNAISTAPWTLPTHASLFTGLYPDRHGVSWGHYKLEEESPVLADLLRQSGYDTFAISNNCLLGADNGYARGFDAFLETANDPNLVRWQLALKCGAPRAASQWLGVPDDAPYDAGSAWTNRLMRRRLAQQGRARRPFFAFINYYEPHDPYEPPERYVNRFLTPHQKEAYQRLRQDAEKLAAHALGVPDVLSAEDVALMSRLYDAEVAYQDEVVGELLTMLSDEGFLSNTWLVVLSDHGELFGEWGMVYHTASSHFRLLHIPLFVRPPGGVPATRIDAPVQPVDVFVTLLEAAGLKPPSTVRRAYRLPLDMNDPVERELCIAQTHAASIAGLSVAQRTRQQLDLSEWLVWTTSVVQDGRILEVDNRGPRGLYDVRDDPEMRYDLLASSPAAAASMTRRFQSWREQGNEGEVAWLSEGR